MNFFHILLAFAAIRSYSGELQHHRIDHKHRTDHKHHNSTSPHNKQKRCGTIHHANQTRPCLMNDQVCGYWTGRWWNPYGCHYQDINTTQARKCIGNRTLAFIGDSQIRDISVGVAFLLLGINSTTETAKDDKFDYHDMDFYATQIPDFPFWSNNVPPHNHNGYTWPNQSDFKKYGYPWQIQMWSLYAKNFADHQSADILSNRMANDTLGLREIDITFWNHGLHDHGFWDKEPYGLKFYDGILTPSFLALHKAAKMPTVWVSMNSECSSKLPEVIFAAGIQHVMVREANRYLNERLLAEGVPYWDADAPMRTPQLCNHSADGVHVKMFVDIMRAKMLFNHLCDSDMNWRASEANFK